MKLRQNIDYKEFLFAVRKCAGEVFYRTSANDSLNLKSLLSEYVFITASHSDDILLDGFVECELDADYCLLSNFLENE